MAVFNVPAIVSAVRQGAMEGIDLTADSVAADARRRAPVRKVFKESKGFRRKFRALTPLERGLAIRRAQTFYANDPFKARQVTAHIQNYARAEVRRKGSLNSLSKSRTLRHLGTIKGRDFTPRVDARVLANRRGVGYESQALKPLLTARGKYEVRSGRAIHKEVQPGGATQVRIGGALKASIENEGATITGSGVGARVTAGIRYAKFVEFPTTRTAAQPFLIPAMQAHRKRLKKDVAAEVRKALGG
jgi:hypothetical protein